MKTVLQFSGGKDSLACLYLLEPRWDDITVAWVNTGAAFPETLALMDEVAKMVPHFAEIRSQQTIDFAGYPADLVPVHATIIGRLSEKGGPKFQSRIDCCAASLWVPMGEYIRQAQPEVIVRGQKLTDRRKSPVRDGDIVAGIRYEFPVESWTDAEVFSYLAARRVKLPKNYQFMMTGLDCWNCTAYLDENPGRLPYMRERHPSLFGHVRGVLEQLTTEINRAQAPLAASLKE